MNLEPLLRQLKIRTKEGTVAPFHPNIEQRKVLAAIERQREARQPVRLIILKARQMGISTAIEGVLFWDSFVYEHRLSMVIAHSKESTQHLFGMTRMYWDFFPYKKLFTPRYNSRRELEWEESGSAISVATAGAGDVGRGRTINSLHASEVAFWPKPDETMLALRQTIPQTSGSFIALESTANGVGNWFHNTWQESVAGDNEYEAIFLPWWEHPGYTASAAGLTIPKWRLDSEERYLKDKLHLTLDRLAWRKWAITNLAGGNLDKFRQEYPATPEEAFLASGSNVFQLEQLRACYEPSLGKRGFLAPDTQGRIVFTADPTGPLTLYAWPGQADRGWSDYFVGGDPAHAGGKDYACAQVINRFTYEQVATWRGRLDPVTFGDELVKLAKYYNDAMIAPEVTGPGYATVGRLLSLNYPHLWRQRDADKTPGRIAEMYGWSTSEKRKNWAIGDLAKLVIDGSLTIHDRITYEEMRAYVNLEQGGFGPAANEGHDDTVMALAIAVVCSRSEGITPYGEIRRETHHPIAPPWELWDNKQGA